MTPQTPVERIARLEGDMAMLKTVIPRVELLEDKVSSFIDRHEAREAERDKIDRHRMRIHFALLGGLISLIVGVSIWFVSWVMEGKHIVVQGNNVTQTQQDAGNPSGYVPRR